MRRDHDRLPRDFLAVLIRVALAAFVRVGGRGMTDAKSVESGSGPAGCAGALRSGPASELTSSINHLNAALISFIRAVSSPIASADKLLCLSGW